MAVEWIGDTANTPLKAKYDLAVSKINELENILVSKYINSICIINLRETLDKIVTESLNAVSKSVNKIIAITNCLAPIDSDTIDTMKNTINNVLNGKILDDYISSIQELIDDDNITEDKICEALRNANEKANAISNANTANSELDETMQKLMQTIGKAAAIINCINDAILNNAQLSENIEKVEPTLKGIFSSIKEAKNTGKDKTTILKEAKEKIADNLNLNDKITDVKNKLSSIV